MSTRKQATEPSCFGKWPMSNLPRRLAHCLFCSLFLLSPLQVVAQSSTGSKASSRSAPIDYAIELAATGQCEKALPVLKKLAPAITDRQLKYKALT